MPPLLIPAGNPGPLTGRGNNTWFIDGATPALVDAGTGTSSHLDALAVALGGRPLARVLLTHSHRDHVDGLPALRARWPDLVACAAASRWAAEAGVELLADGDRVLAGDTQLDVVATPGHAADHLCFWDAAERDLFTGDLLVAGGTVLVTVEGGGVGAYLDSLARIDARDPRVIHPAHGRVIDHPHTLIAEYVAHRRQRHAQILACRDAGVTDPDEIVTIVYPDLAPALRSAARATVLAHLHDA